MDDRLEKSHPARIMIGPDFFEHVGNDVALGCF